jgi:sterol desaturase/sphingolipid hydroxylase (fatty acid hydroxylase superfamily)
MKKKSKLLDREPPGWLNGLLIVGTALTILYFENKRPLRKTRQDKVRRNIRNFAMSVTTAATIRVSEKPLTTYLMKEGERRNIGLIRMVRMPAWLEVALSVALLDYTLFVWHYLTHRIPLLWRLHQSHHVDLDLDASTALRFHPAEMLLSAPWRGAQVFLLGISPFSLSLWQLMTLLEIMFHHSNIELPLDFERKLVKITVTPRMHGIHHSIVQEETDSNWSTIFTWPDLIHGTLQLNVPQNEVTIGVPAFQDPKELTIGKVLKMPATADRPSWRLGENGKPERDRRDLPGPKIRLVT